MTNKLGDIIKKAFKDAGVDLPKSETAAPKKASPLEKHNEAHQFKRKSQKRRPKNRKYSAPAKKKESASLPNLSVYSSSKPRPNKDSSPTSTPAYTLSLGETSRVLPENSDRSTGSLMIPVRSNGRMTTLHKTPNGLPDYELTLGFDFGTSSTKVVIGDPQQNKAFAIPFWDVVGVDRYLLPGRLFQNAEYSLTKGHNCFRDLKLALLDSQNNMHSEHAVAFMALTIRHARAWIFENYESLYRDKHIFWNLAIGMPSIDLHGGDGFKSLLANLALAAWIVSTDAKVLDTESIQLSISRASTELTKSPPNPDLPEILVYPEVTAQIYGFVSGKDAFDPKGRNLYLLVDIGAGTIDTSLFHVSRGTGDHYNFTTFTSTVEFNGAVNLHRSRIDWWMNAVSEPNVSREDLAGSLNSAFISIDCTTRIPTAHEDYVTESTVHWSRPNEHPDELFMSKRVRPQILEKTYIDAWKKGHLEQADIAGVPAFLCGGGMRMPFYKNLLKILDRREKNAAWVRAKPRRMAIPERLEAKGLPTDDYDRLSVAYGLSLMRVGTHAQSAEGSIPKRTDDIVERGTYISKEMT